MSEITEFLQFLLVLLVFVGVTMVVTPFAVLFIRKYYDAYLDWVFNKLG